MKIVLFDTNVLLDVLLDRQPHVAAAARVWTSVERRIARGYVAAHAVATIHYLAARQRDRGFAREVIADLLSVFEVAAVDGKTIARALDLAFADFEDAITAASAEQRGCDVIVTRDLKGFHKSPVHGMLPSELADVLKKG